ncbi:MAG: tetratricopeptide repeat protein [Candidatus Goldbacteria bacterium]|nr:tetratricopeptide repeat protein [Candidatus Goldiibacteriota bacterium]
MVKKVFSKFLFILFVLALIVPPSFCGSDWYLSLTGGMNSVLMGEYNQAIKEANDYNTSIGIKSSLKPLAFGLLPSLEVGYNFNAPAGLAAVYLKNEVSIIRDTESIALWPNGKTAQKISGDFSAIYTGIGLKKYAFDESAFNPYIGLDAGLTYSFNNTMDEESALEDGTYSYRIKKSWDTAFAGISAEAGANWMFSESAGINLKTGYRYSRGTVMVKTENVYGWTGESQGQSQVDYSGFYFGAGLLIGFGNTEKTAAIKTLAAGSEQFPEIGKKIYTDGVTLFDAGLYKRSEIKFLELNQISPGNSDVKKYLDEIAVKLEGDKKQENIKKLLAEADELRGKNKFEGAYNRYLEVNKIDAENETAVFYLKYFRETAVAKYGDARELNSQGKIAPALKLAKEAAEYSPENNEIADFVKELQGIKKDKKKADALYNEGVLNYQKGYYDKAIVSWEKVLEIYPDDIETKKNLALAKEKYSGESAKAVQSAQEAMGQAKEFFDRGLLEDARSKAEYVLRIDSKDEDAIKLLAEIDRRTDKKSTTLIKR